MLLSCFYNWTFAQADLCDRCYLWSFSNDKGERDETTRLLTDAVEDIISQYSACTVLQRARYAKLQEQINNEKAILSLSTASAQIKEELKAIQAKRVVFGSVNRDFQGNIALRLSFENLITTQVKSNTIFMTGDDYYNFDKRKEKLTAFVNSFINPDGKLISPTTENNVVNDRKSILQSLATQTIDGIKVTINKFEQAGNRAIFYFTFENLSAANQVRKIRTHGNFNNFIDQDGNTYHCEKFTLGNNGDYSEIEIIYQTPVKCTVQFDVGAVKITKAAKLKIGGYNYDFQFINMKL